MTVHQLHHPPQKSLPTATSGAAILEFTYEEPAENGPESREPLCKLKSFGTKAETLHQLNWRVPDWFVIPVGNAGNISALGKGLRELYDLGIIDKVPRLAGVQTIGASPLYESYKNGYADLIAQKAQPTKASAIQIGDPVSFKKAVRELKHFNGVVEAVSETELMDWKAQIDRLGISICPNSAVAVSGAMKLMDNGVINNQDDVVIILTAHGGKFSNMAVKYHSEQTNQFANQMLIIKPLIDELERTLEL